MSFSSMSLSHHSVSVQVKENKLELNNNEISCKNNNIVMVNGYSDAMVEVSLVPQLCSFFALLDSFRKI